jgi:hypothetical protein
MGIFEAVRRAAAAEGELHPRWADAYPSLERNGLRGFADSERSGLVPMDTGHRLFLAASDSHPDWDLHITHAGDLDDFGIPRRKVVAQLGPGDHDVGDRVIRALRHPQVMQEMREMMKPAQPGEWWHHEVKV